MTTWYEKKYGSHYPYRRSWAARNKAVLIFLSASFLSIVFFAAIMVVTFCHLAPRAIVMEMDRQVSVLVAQMGGE
jgi:hypothetical protein